MSLKELSVKNRKFIRSLHQKKYRDQNNLFIIEGTKVAQEAFDSELEIECAVFSSEEYNKQSSMIEEFSLSGIQSYIANEEHFRYISDAQNPQGLLLVVKKPKNAISEHESFIALEGVSDPGNVGSIIRTADWFGFNNILIDKNCADPFSPKVTRSTMGSIIRENIYQVDNICEYLSKKFLNFEIYGASLKGKVFLEECAPQNKFGIIFGNESKGLSSQLEKRLSSAFLIKGYGKAESLNVAIAGGISMNWFAKFNSK